MSQKLIHNASSQDWADERGKKWRDQLSGLEAMLEPVDAPLIEALRLDGPVRIAEIGCGGGGTTVKVLEHAPEGSSVHGIDISPDLADIARARLEAHESDGEVHVANVESAPAPAGSYDRLLSRFGIMFFERPQAAFSNIATWLAPGGRFAFAVWGEPEKNPWMISLRDAVAEVMEVPLPDIEAPGPFRYGEGDRLLEHLNIAGLSDLHIHDWYGTLRIGGGVPPAEAVDFAFDSFSLGELLADASDAENATVRDLLLKRYLEEERDDGVHMEACVHIVTGVRPA
ncbi:MAG: class I SAM-dependent methyltransferase [Pseudomonadota bacterium]